MKRILLIDDNPINNNRFIECLKKHYEVDVAMYLLSATRLLRRRKYDLIIIDVMMPTQNLEWTKEMETGFFYYEKEIKPLGLKIPILFWSRLSKESFNIYFRGKKPENLHFVHKIPDENKFLDVVMGLIGR